MNGSWDVDVDLRGILGFDSRWEDLAEAAIGSDKDAVVGTEDSDLKWDNGRGEGREAGVGARAAT